MTTTYHDVKLTYDTDTFGFSVTAGNEVRWALDRKPKGKIGRAHV